jgi:hypothetical protein
MDYIDETLATQSLNNVELSPCIHVALVLGKQTLNKYYSKTDNAHSYRITMSQSIAGCLIHRAYYCSVFNPEYKLIYFKIAGWDIIWIEQARKLIYDMYNRKYAPTADTAIPKPVSEEVRIFYVHVSLQLTFYASPTLISLQRIYLTCYRVFGAYEPRPPNLSWMPTLVLTPNMHPILSNGGLIIVTFTPTFPGWFATTWPYQVSTLLLVTHLFYLTLQLHLPMLSGYSAVASCCSLTLATGCLLNQRKQ